MGAADKGRYVRESYRRLHIQRHFLVFLFFDTDVSCETPQQYKNSK
jgi:hypothetical protein